MKWCSRRLCVTPRRCDDAAVGGLRSTRRCRRGREDASLLLAALLLPEYVAQIEVARQARSAEAEPSAVDGARKEVPKPCCVGQSRPTRVGRGRSAHACRWDELNDIIFSHAAISKGDTDRRLHGISHLASPVWVGSPSSPRVGGQQNSGFQEPS